MSNVPYLIQERDERIEMRRIAKAYYDEKYDLNSKTDNKKTMLFSSSSETLEDGRAVLLDEGALVYSEGSIWFYLKKGTIQDFYDNLSDDYVGTWNKGHADIAEDPIRLGKWSKKDLEVVDIGNGRKRLLVDINLNEDLSVVQDLKKQEHTLSVSAEMFTSTDYEASKEYGFQVVDAIDIRDIAIVGDPGNVTSAGVTLKSGRNEKMGIFDKREAKEAKEVKNLKKAAKTLKTSEDFVQGMELLLDKNDEYEKENLALKKEVEDLKAKLSTKEEQIIKKEEEVTEKDLEVIGRFEKFLSAMSEKEDEEVAPKAEKKDEEDFDPIYGGEI